MYFLFKSKIEDDAKFVRNCLTHVNYSVNSQPIGLHQLVGCSPNYTFKQAEMIHLLSRISAAIYCVDVFTLVGI